MGILKNKIPWDLQQRGLRDSQRHAKKVKDAIRKNLHHIISQEAIISTDGKRTTKVPVRYLDSYHFKHGKMKDGVGHGDGEEGTILRPGRGNDEEGGESRPGDQPGADVYDAEIGVDELLQMMLDDLKLPWFEERDKKSIIVKHIEYTDLRKKGPMARWAKRKTVLENIKRNATESGNAKFYDLHDEDMRFRSWDEKIERHSNAVVYLMMDRSGSMDEHKRYLTKALFWWLCRFLETAYDCVEIVFIAHDVEAKVVPEKDFFLLSNDGGTRCSSAYELALKDIKENRPQNSWNVYCFHFSDGDNFEDDSGQCKKLVLEMLERVNMFAYGEVAWENANWQNSSELMNALEDIDHPRFMTAVLHEKEDVYPTLRKFLRKELGVESEDEKEEKEDEPS